MEVIVQENGAPTSIASATTKVFVLVDPRGNAKRKPGAFSGDGTDGKLRVPVTADFWDAPGKWKVFAHCIIPDAPNPDLDRYSVEIPANIAPTYGRTS